MSAGPTAKVPDPITLENRGESWKQFRREWKFYEIATKISKEEDDVRIAALMNVIGREGMDLFDTFQWQANEDQDKIEDVLRKFDAQVSSSLKSQVVLLQTAHSWANAGVLLGARMHRERGSFRSN